MSRGKQNRQWHSRHTVPFYFTTKQVTGCKYCVQAGNRPKQWVSLLVTDINRNSIYIDYIECSMQDSQYHLFLCVCPFQVQSKQLCVFICMKAAHMILCVFVCFNIRLVGQLGRNVAKQKLVKREQTHYQRRWPEKDGLSCSDFFLCHCLLHAK